MLHRYPGLGEALDHRQHTAALLVRIDPAGAGAGRLPADIDQIGTRGVHGPPVGDGVLDPGVTPAVGERVGGDVEHADHDDPVGAPG